MHQVNRVNADRREWPEPDLRRSIDFHAVLLAMAGHDLRQSCENEISCDVVVIWPSEET